MSKIFVFLEFISTILIWLSFAMIIFAIIRGKKIVNCYAQLILSIGTIIAALCTLINGENTTLFWFYLLCSILSMFNFQRFRKEFVQK